MNGETKHDATPRAKYDRREKAASRLLIAMLVFIIPAVVLGMTVDRDNPSVPRLCIAVGLALPGLACAFIAAILIRPFSWPCPHCRRLLSDSLFWRCGACERSNQHSMFEVCEGCSRRPTACQCPGCQGVSVLDPGAEVQAVARLDAASDGYALRGKWLKTKSWYLAAYIVGAPFGAWGIWTWGSDIWNRGLVSDRQAVILIHVAILALAIWALSRCESTPTRWRCHACGKGLDSGIPWICGFCNQENGWRTFLWSCSSCKAKPPGYVCNHCGEVTPLLMDGDERHPARPIPRPLAGETEAQARTRRENEIAERLHEIERLKHEAEIRSLTAQAERFKSPPPAVNGETALEEQLERALKRLKIGMRAVARSKQLQIQVDEEIVANEPKLPEEEVERLREYAKRQFDTYREDITLGRYEQ
jgi:hypothetical protein